MAGWATLLGIDSSDKLVLRRGGLRETGMDLGTNVSRFARGLLAVFQDE
jgi:hypothetical protein